MAKKSDKNAEIRIQARLLPSDDAASPDADAYVFSGSGKALAHAALDAKGRAIVRIPAAAEAQALRILVGPRPAEGEATPSLASLTRRDAAEARLRLEPGTARGDVDLTVPPEVWRCWWITPCVVPGTLVKRTAGPEGPVDLPVCNAVVRVFEVDPLIRVLPRLPDDVIERIRDVLIRPPEPVPPPDPWPHPWPEPWPEPEPLPGPRPPAPRPDPAPMVAEPLRLAAMHATTPALRTELQAHPQIVAPLLCRFVPWLVHKELVATAETDDCGRFRAVFFRRCDDPDTPDLYFEAEKRLLPFPFPALTIHAPTPVACHTHWNYLCGREVTLVTHHPLAAACPPCPPVDAEGNWVLVMAVGNHPLSRIHGTSQALQATTGPTNLGLTDTGAPWGGLLRLRLEFDHDLRGSLGVRYYRVSWRQGTSGAFTPLSGEVMRHYAHDVGGDLVIEPYPLGPKVVGGRTNLFEIPPALPPQGQWSLPDVVEDTTSAKFPTTVHAPATQAGTYQLRVDLFDAAGDPVDIGAQGIDYVVPTSTDLTGTIHTTSAAGLGLVDGNAFVMTLHVDNNACAAAVHPPTRHGVEASPSCSVLDYDPADLGAVAMPYHASHPNGFASHSFRVVRGVTLVASEGGPAPGDATPVETVADLLGGCTVAGFSEHLHVAASATDGWSRQRGLDRSAVRAFVLAPADMDTP